jgi:(heptosyl)LPS beta-1,4-glucosyltransferase
MAKLSIIVLTKNEEKNIGPCLESVAWADELIVLDALSEDKTVEIARAHGARVHQHPFRDFAAQRNAALELTTHEWVLFVDADERATPALAAEVRRVIERDEPVGWWVPRRNYIFGRWVRHAGWYPDYQLRLFRRARGRYDEAREVHELVILDGPAGYLENTLTHYNYNSLAQFFARQDVYTDYEARIMYRQGLRARPHNFVLQPLREFRRRYIELEGYKDGWLGLLLSLLMAYYELVKYGKLWRMRGFEENGGTW